MGQGNFIEDFKLDSIKKLWNTVILLRLFRSV